MIKTIMAPPKEKKKKPKKIRGGASTMPAMAGGSSGAPLGPKPTNESLEERFNDSAPAPLPYVSPYEMSADPAAEATTVTF